jgi:hypothetical protein
MIWLLCADSCCTCSSCSCCLLLRWLLAIQCVLFGSLVLERALLSQQGPFVSWHADGNLAGVQHRWKPLY